VSVLQTQRLKRDELLQILLELEQENEQLATENRDLRRRLSDRTIALEEAGTLAEAALALSGVFESAQAAADLYRENVERAADKRAREAEEMLGRTRELCLCRAREAQELLGSAVPDKTDGRASLVEEVERLFEDADDGVRA